MINDSISSFDEMEEALTKAEKLLAHMDAEVCTLVNSVVCLSCTDNSLHASDAKALQQTVFGSPSPCPSLTTPLADMQQIWALQFSPMSPLKILDAKVCMPAIFVTL